MSDIFNYLKYRDYLSDFYREKKAANPSFSYHALSQKAGFKSRSFIPHVIEGTKNLSEKSAAALSGAMDLTERQAEFFELLVRFDQAPSHRLKDSYFLQLAEKCTNQQTRLLLSSSHAFFSHWYHATIRELVTILDFKDDYAALARMLKPRITVRQARQSVNLLVRLGLITQKDGRWVHTDKNMTTGDAVQSLAVENFHLQNLRLAGESIDNCPSQERDISCMVIGLSQPGYERIKTEVRSFRNKLVAIINEDEPADRVYHFNMQLYPTSDRVGERKNP
jgi:uncharacterized protein (TIGR02147 family)